MAMVFSTLKPSFYMDDPFDSSGIDLCLRRSRLRADPATAIAECRLQGAHGNASVVAVRKTLRTLRGIDEELGGAVTIASQFKDYVEQIRNLFTG